MKAVIMAGGSGTRLRPLTCDIPKPMVPILNRPVMEHIINLLKREGIEEIAVTTYYLPRAIKEYFGNGEKWGVNLHYYHEESPLGTAGSVQNAADFLDETFVVISGDAVTDFNLNQAISFHQEMRAEATLVLTRVAFPLEYGVVITDENYKITSFLEKPAWSQVFSDTINTGIYILEPSIFNYYKKGIKYDFSQDLFPLMLKAEKALYGLPLSGYWNDIGTIQDYYETNCDFMMGKIDLDLAEVNQLAEGIFLEDGVEVDPSARLTAPIFIGANSSIKEGVRLQSSVIGKNIIIKEGSSLKNSLIWDNSIIGKRDEIRGSVLADGVKLADDISIYDRTVLGRLTKIGKNTAVKPGVKIWPEKVVEENSEVDRSIIAPNRWQDRLFKEDTIRGIERVDITADFLTRVGSALSSFLPEGVELAINSDSSREARAYKLVLAGSLTTSGNDIIDLGDLSKPALKYNIGQLQVDCGIHLSKTPDLDEIVINFFDSRGIDLAEKSKKAIEKKYFTEKYRTRIVKIGEYSHLPGRYREHLRKIEQKVALKKIKENYFKIVVKSKKNLSYSIKKLLRKFNCQIIEKDFMDNKKDSLADPAGERADLYLKFFDDGERIVIFDDKKRLIDRVLFQLMLSVILIDKGREKLYLPVTYPRAIEEYARMKNSQVVYTRSGKRASADLYYKEILDEKERENGWLYSYQDGFYSLALILEKMALEDKKLSEIVDSLPELYYQRAEIPCDWEEKGKVMRLLAQEADNKDDLLDGVHFEHDDGWALVLPDGEKPIFHVFVEGADMETAESLTGYYLNKVKEIITDHSQ